MLKINSSALSVLIFLVLTIWLIWRWISFKLTQPELTIFFKLFARE